MRILYVSMDPGVHLNLPGGGAIHIRGFVRALAELGHEVLLLTSSSGVAATENGVRIRQAPLAAWNQVLGRAIRRANTVLGRPGREHPDLVRILHNVTFRKAVDGCVRSFEPDLIYERYSLWGVCCASIAARSGVPYALEVNAPLAYEQERYRGLSVPALARLTERRLWRRPDLLVAVSEGLRPHLERAGVLPRRTLVVPNGVDPALFHPAVDGGAVRNRLGLSGKFVIGCSGTFKPWHGMDLLLDAFGEVHREYPAAHLLLVGDGPLRRRLEEGCTAGRAGAVTFTGSVPHDEMPAYLAAMDVAVAPYPRLEEQYYSPLKLFEYMATGRPVVASRSGQAAQILTDGVTALLFEAGDRKGLVDCIRRLRNDTALRELLGRNAAQACRAFTWRNNAARVLQRLDQLCGRPERNTAVRTQEHTVA